MGTPAGYGRCDSCGKRQRVPSMKLVAYRAAGSRQGPWLAERLCFKCVEWYREAGYWTVRLLEPVEQVYRGVVMGQHRML